MDTKVFESKIQEYASKIEMLENKIEKLEKKVEGQKTYIGSLSAAYDRVKVQTEEKQKLIEKYQEERKKNLDPDSAFETIKDHYGKLIGIVYNFIV